MYYKKLRGKKCYLSPIDPNEYEKFIPWINDMEVGIGTGFASWTITVGEEKKALEKMSSEHQFVILDNETDTLIGTLRFREVNHLDRKGEVGIFIGNKEYRGRGYGSEAMRLLLDYGFNILNLHNISLKVFSYNREAIKSYKKVGFKEVGRIRECKMVGGRYFDDVIMDILSTEFESPYINDILAKKQGIRG